MSVGSFMLRSAANVVNCLHFTAYLMPFKIYTIATHIEDFPPVIILKMLSNLDRFAVN